MEAAKKSDIVKRGYDRRASEYHANRPEYDNSKELEEFANLLPQNARILDAGCGAGVPVAKFLIESRFDVTGLEEHLEERRFNAEVGSFRANHYFLCVWDRNSMQKSQRGRS